MRVFAAIFVLLVAASAVAWGIRPAPAAGGKVPLVLVSDDNPSRRQYVADFNRLHPGLDLRLDPDNGGTEKVIVQSLGGVGPDLFDCKGPSDLAAYVRAGIAWDVTDELAAAGVDVRRDAWPAMLPALEFEGRVYGFPTNVNADVLWFNKDVFDRAGVPYPAGGATTWDEFLPLAKRLTVRGPDGRATQFGFTFDAWAWKFFLVQWGGSVYSADGTRCTIDAPEAVAAVQFMHDLIYVHRVSPSPGDEDAMAQAGGFGTTSLKAIGAGRAATAVGGRWWLTTLRNYRQLRLGAVESPHGPVRQFPAYGRATLINRASPRRREALEFLKYLAGPDYNRAVNWQADGIAPVKRFGEADADLLNPAFPAEDYHRAFRSAVALAVPERVSPYVSTGVAEQLISDQLEFVRRDGKTAADAMRTAAAQVHDAMRKALRRDPALRARYERATGGRLP